MKIILYSHRSSRSHCQYVKIREAVCYQNHKWAIALEYLFLFAKNECWSVLWNASAFYPEPLETWVWNQSNHAKKLVCTEDKQIRKYIHSCRTLCSHMNKVHSIWSLHRICTPNSSPFIFKTYSYVYWYIEVSSRIILVGFIFYFLTQLSSDSLHGQLNETGTWTTLSGRCQMST